MSTKLAPPDVESALARPRLFELLDAARRRPIVWIGGPAGSGKSTLVASYARARGLRCLWYSVDARDADPGALFYYLGRAAEAFTRNHGAPLPLLTTHHPSGAFGFARRYFETLFERIEPPALVIFDDCPAPSAAEHWYSLLREACASVPAGITLVFVSRSAPGPTFARLLASSRVSMISWEDLRLSSDEAGALAEHNARQLGVELLPADLALLEREVGGWAAGIILALECARRERRPKQPTFADTSQQLFDYFAAEVLVGLDRGLSDLLLKSAFLPVLTGVALGRLLDTNDGARQLARLKAENLFLQEHGTSPPSYRYHPLFRSFLLARARGELGLEQSRELERKAARALAEAGEIESALEMFLGALDHAGAKELLVLHAPVLAQQGRSHTIRDAVDRLPEQELEGSPWLCFWAGIAHLGTSPGRAVGLTERAFEAFRVSGNHHASWLACRALVHAYLADGDDLRRLDPVLELLHDAIARGDFTGTELEVVLLRTAAFGMAMHTPGDPRTQEYVERALLLPYRDSEELTLSLLCWGFRGEVARFADHISRWERRAKRENSEASVRIGLLLSRVFHALITGELAAVHRLVSEALDTSERAGWFLLNRAFLVYLAYAHAARGDLGALRLAVDDLAEIAEIGTPSDLGNYRFCAGLEAVQSGDVPRALRSFIDATADAERLAAPLAVRLHRLGFVEALLLSGDFERAEHELSLCSDVDAVGLIVGQSTRLMRAFAASLLGRDAEADELLAQALALGARHGFVPVPVPTPRTLASLLERARRRNIEPEYTRELVLKLEPERQPSEPNGGRRPSAVTRPVPPAFAKALRSALRRLHETRPLSENPLLHAELVERRVGSNANLAERVAALREVLREGVILLSASGRTEPLYLALHHTYIEPAPTQLLAAESARMSFGTYRRHLAAGLDELATALWLGSTS